MKKIHKSIYRFLDKNGDGSGDQNAAEDYSVTPQEFYFQPTTHVDLHRLIIHIEDTSGMQAQEYGNLGAALANGYTVKIIDDDGTTELMDLCNGILITTNANLGRTCYDVDVKTWGAGNEVLQCRWTFAKAGQPLRLNQGQRISITFNDDLSGLIEHYFMVQGYAV